MLYQIVWILCAIKEGLHFGCSSGTPKLITGLTTKKLTFSERKRKLHARSEEH